MRVISGIAKGCSLRAPRGRRTRPTADRVKEALFNVLGASVEGAKVLDLYAGSGSLAIEALSRGAAEAFLVDTSQEAVNIIRSNLKTTGFSGKTKIMKNKVGSALEILRQKEEHFDLIFIDPPYTINLIELRKVFNRLLNGNLLAPYAQIVLESSSRVRPLEFPGFTVSLSRKYGDSLLNFYKLEEEGS